MTTGLVTSDPVQLGSILFTLVEPHRGYEVAYNRWYERDHLYAGVMIGPYAFSAGRFVCPRRLKALRYPDPSPLTGDARTGSYLALYWVLARHHDEWWRWARRQVRALIGAGRMFEHRTHVHTQLYEYRGAVERDDDGVPPELALDHRFPGLAVVVGRAWGDRHRALDVLERDVVPAVLAGSPVALCLSFVPYPMPPGQPSQVPPSTQDDVRFLQLWFCDQDPGGVWEIFASLPDRYARVAEVVFASPFVPTVPGTDRYTDELW